MRLRPVRASSCRRVIDVWASAIAVSSSTTVKWFLGPSHRTSQTSRATARRTVSAKSISQSGA
jgi:hypothetical protein